VSVPGRHAATRREIGDHGPVGGPDAERVRFGVVIPIHNEEALAAAALASLDMAMRHADGPLVSVGVAVVLDACQDGSKAVVAEWRRRCLEDDGDRHIQILETQVGNVGYARGMGCAALLREWAAVPLETIWLATTDADSEVPASWITAQLGAKAEKCDLWAGGVGVHDWTDRQEGTAEAWHRQNEAEHSPIHGANFGIAASLYLQAGGFDELSTGEDRALFERALALGAKVERDPSVLVMTSARREARAPHGFAHALASIELAIAASALAPAS
jgi:Glycosyl transferase family 2